MIRTIIKIDEEVCNGCGLCVNACHEGALRLIDGKARLVRDDYCDGLGDCLPTCPVGAISFVKRQAKEYDEKAVFEAKACHDGSLASAQGGGCPGTTSRFLGDKHKHAPCQFTSASSTSALAQWPVQIKLVPPQAPYFKNAHVLVAADCTAFANPDFHRRFMDGKITLIACPKLDDIDYSEKLTEIFSTNTVLSVSVVRMEVPCCGGLQHAVSEALARSGKQIPLNVITLSIRGEVLSKQ